MPAASVAGFLSLMWEFFDQKVCLTADAGEWQKAVDEFARVGLSVHKFDAMPDIGPHQSFNRSTRQILIQFFESDGDSLLFLEDDCWFQDLSQLQHALAELPADWDIVYLGANIQDEKPERVSDYVYRIRAAWTTHCIGYRRKVIPFILENQPGFSEQMYDNWLSSQLPNLHAYVINPMVAWQRPRVSKIWNNMADYSEHFERSQKLLA
jgi:hypothetical protein